jgi:anti-sigma factor RsiW
VNCTESQELLDAYLDGEFDLRTSLDVEAHLRSCAACRDEFEAHRKLQEAMAGADLYFRAPVELRKRVRAATGSKPRRWMLWAAPVLATAAVLLLMVLLSVMRPPGSHGEEAVLASHLRSLEPNHLIDVVSSDSHTVKPWFNGKVDFSPPVSDLKAQGFPLVGGRLDYVDRNAAAALVYKRREHVVNLFVWPENAPDSGPHAETRRGFHLLEWQRSGFHYWAVSDLNAAELGEFERLLK